MRKVIDLTDGTTVQELRYDEFGRVLEDISVNFEQPFGYAGGLYDSVTGLTRFGVRDYDPYLGRWLTQDSLGFAAADTNLYRYVYGSPLSFVDIDGRMPFWVVPVVVGVVLGLGLPGAYLGVTYLDGSSYNDAYPNEASLNRALEGTGKVFLDGLPEGVRDRGSMIHFALSVEPDEDCFGVIAHGNEGTGAMMSEGLVVYNGGAGDPLVPGMGNLMDKIKSANGGLVSECIQFFVCHAGVDDGPAERAHKAFGVRTKGSTGRVRYSNWGGYYHYGGDVFECIR